MTVRRYSLLSSQAVIVALGVVALWLGFGMWWIYKQSGNVQPGWYQVIFWVIWFTIVMSFAFRTATSAREIIVHENDEIEFVSVLERKRLLAREICSIQVLKGEYSRIVVRHSSGKIYLAGAMNDFHQFLSDLKHANPGIELEGC
jgi:hypothetical protein